MTELTADNVDSIFMKCLFEEEEDKTKYVEANGVLAHVGFHPERLKEHTPAITEMILQLPKEFMDDSEYKGASFLRSCMTDNGVHWAEHSTMDKLLCLGLAIGKIEYNLPRAFWGVFPGGMPYFTVLNKTNG